MKIGTGLLALAAACTILCSCDGAADLSTGSGSISCPVAVSEEEPAGSTSAPQGDVSQPDDSQAAGEEGPETVPGYDFTQDAPENERVEDDYFGDAAFVGDSRTDGLLIYGGMKGATNLTSNGLSIFKLAEKKALTIDGTKYTLLEALALHQYGKVYLSLGVNELGMYDDPGFYRAYCAAIDSIRASQPNAVIYIQGLIPLNESVIAQTGGRSYLTNDHLRIYNDLMRQTAREKNVVFLDLYSAFADENGELPVDASKDGVHLRKSYCEQWMEYLRTHTVSYESYAAGLAAAEQMEDGE